MLIAGVSMGAMMAAERSHEEAAVDSGDSTAAVRVERRTSICVVAVLGEISDSWDAA